MSQHFSHDDELLTSLFDGELSGEQRAAAEQLLAGNPEYQAQFEAWQKIGDRLRRLPRHQLQSDVSGKVLDEIARRQSSVANSVVGSASVVDAANSGGASAKLNWRGGAAAIASLAALLLATLFVFPNLVNNSSDQARVAQSNEVAPNRQLEIGKDAAPRTASSVSKAAAVEEAQDATESGGKRERVEPESFSMEQELAGGFVPEMKQLASDADQQRPLEVAAPAMPPATTELAAVAESFSASAADEAAAVPPLQQILWIDVDAEVLLAGENEESTLPALAMVTKALQRNSITMVADSAPASPFDQNDFYGDALGKDFKNDTNQSRAQSPAEQGILDSLDDKATSETQEKSLGARALSAELQSLKSTVPASSPTGVEAITVVATVEQMKQAVIEISNNAKVSGFEIPRQQFAARRLQSYPLSTSSFDSLEEPKFESKPAQTRNRESVRSKKPSLARQSELEAIDRWFDDSNLDARVGGRVNDIRIPRDSVSPPAPTAQPQVQYLLLIRTPEANR